MASLEEFCLINYIFAHSAQQSWNFCENHVSPIKLEENICKANHVWKLHVIRITFPNVFLNRWSWHFAKAKIITISAHHIKMTMYSLRNNHYGQKFYLINELDTFSCNSQKADKERANACNCLFFGGPLQLWDVIIYCIIHIRWYSIQFKYGSYLYKRKQDPIHI